MAKNPPIVAITPPLTERAVVAFVRFGDNEFPVLCSHIQGGAICGVAVPSHYTLSGISGFVMPLPGGEVFQFESWMIPAGVIQAIGTGRVVDRMVEPVQQAKTAETAPTNEPG